MHRYKSASTLFPVPLLLLHLAASTCMRIAWPHPLVQAWSTSMPPPPCSSRKLGTTRYMRMPAWACGP